MKKKKTRKLGVDRTAKDNVKIVLGGKYFKAQKGFNYLIMQTLK